MVWGPLIAIYLFLAGASAGAFLASAYIERKYPDAVRMRVAGRILAPIFIGIGLVMLMVDAEAGLHNPLRFIFLIMNPGSVMTLGVYFICVFMPVALIEAVLELLKKDVPRWLTVIGDVFAFAVAAYTGFLLGVVDAYPLWNNAILPVLFVISALASGLAAVNLCGLILDRENIEKMFDLKKGHVVLGAAEIIALVVMFIMSAIYRKSLVTTPELQAELMQMDEKAAITDHSLLKRSLFVLGLTILGFFTHSFTHIESSLIALTGGFLLLLLAGGSEHLVEKAMHSVEWPTIFFFIGLFIAVGGLIEVGIIAQLAETAVEATGGDLTATALLILWMSAIISSVLDNIPFVATMIPLIQNMGAMGITNLEPLWWSLALGACLGGNGTLVGASANLIVAGMAAERGVHISFIRYFKIGFPLMILTIVLSTVYVYLRYLI